MTTRQTKALALRFSSLGDIVLCSAFVKKWSELNPSGELSFVTFEHFALLLKDFPRSPRMVPLKKQNLLNFFRRGFSEAAYFAGSDFQIYDLQGNLKSWAFLKGLQLGFLRNEKKWTSVRKTPRQGARRLLSVWLRKNLLGSRKIYIEHQRLLTPQDFLSPELKSEKHGPLNDFDGGGILLAPDSQHWKKKIPPSICESLILEILNKSFDKVTIVGPEGYLDAKTLAAWDEKFPGRINNLLGKTHITDLAWVAAQHRLCICGNSAWLHICEAVGVPVLSFAGPIVEGFGFAPWRSESVELALELPCRPCTRHGGGACSLSGADFHACIKRVDWRPRLKEFLENSL